MSNTITDHAVAVDIATLPPSVIFGLDRLPPVGAWPWPAGGLDPVATGSGSLAGLSGCAAMTFGLIANKLKEVMPDSVWQTIGRRQLRRAFNGGTTSAADCGALQGALWMMILVGLPIAFEHELYKWYCEFAFPSTDWDDLYPIKNTVRSISRSPRCQESRHTWEGVFNTEVYPVTGVYDTTRCSKLPRDCARKAVLLINECKVGRHTLRWEGGTH